MTGSGWTASCELDRQTLGHQTRAGQSTRDAGVWISVWTAFIAGHSPYPSTRSERDKEIHSLVMRGPLKGCASHPMLVGSSLQASTLCSTSAWVGYLSGVKESSSLIVIFRVTHTQKGGFHLKFMKFSEIVPIAMRQCIGCRALPYSDLVSLRRSEVVRVLVDGCRFGRRPERQHRHSAWRKLSRKLRDMKPYTMGFTQLHKHSHLHCSSYSPCRIYIVVHIVPAIS